VPVHGGQVTEGILFYLILLDLGQNYAVSGRISRFGDPLMAKARSTESYSAAKIAAIVDALCRRRGIGGCPRWKVSAYRPDTFNSPTTRVALDQIIDCYHNATRLTGNPHFALHLGLKVHVSAYGMYGFALLSGTDFRKIMQAAIRYHNLVAPLDRDSLPRRRRAGVLVNGSRLASARRRADV